MDGRDLSRVAKSIYEIKVKGCYIFLERLDLPENAEVRVKGFYGILREWKVDTQKLKDELRSMHG